MTAQIRSRQPVKAVRLDPAGDRLIILDQTLLPNTSRYLELSQTEAIVEAIRSLRVRGAPAIGITAAYGFYLAVRQSVDLPRPDLLAVAGQARQALARSRPTAVNLFWALDRMDRCLKAQEEQSNQDLAERLRQEADQIAAEDLAVCRRIGIHGLSLLTRGDSLLTHCNAGELATAGYGTALAPVFLGHEQGYDFHVYADETRPLLQGARLTAWELQQAGIRTTLLCDNMAASLLSQGKIKAILVGCDRVAVNGDTANKIGTCGLAILARYYQVPFYVCAPLSTIDPACPSGQAIPIETRKADEVTTLWYRQPMAPAGIGVYNPAFDVTGHELISAFITENGIIRPPYEKQLSRLVSGSCGQSQH